MSKDFAVEEMEDPAVTRFREYLRINTMHPTPDYDKALAFLRQQAVEIGLEFRQLESGVKGRPLGLMTWKGRDPHAKSILLTSHMDVVPVFPESWKYEPFSAHKDDNGDIYARGAQDMKCVTNWYLEAIRRFKSEGRTFLRTIHLLFTSDEEIGSQPSEVFAESQEFRDLNCVFGLDEGIANEGEATRLFYGERSIWWVKVNCEGRPGHASAFIEDSAAKKLQYVMNKFLGLRDEMEEKYKNNLNDGIGKVITVNMTMLEGGVQPNVVPATLSATFDIRIPPTQDQVAFKNQIKSWCEEAGTGVTFEMLVEGKSTHMVKLSEDNPFWVAFKEASERMKVKLQPEIFPAGTDSRFFRKAGVDMLGFSPLNNTPILLHDHNERLNEKTFLKGIDIYYEIIPALANLEI